ncbi:MAG: hypothetical protein ABW154_09960 [Dyella sp.]
MTHTPDQLPSVPQPPSRMAQAITNFIAQIPPSRVEQSNDPDAQARRVAASAAQRAALTAGSLALPPGPLGWLTVLPELVAIWKIQGQMISDIAAVYGKHTQLGREQMLWCLFRHTAAQAFRDLVVRLGDRMLFRRISFGALQHLTQRIGVKVSQRLVGKGISRWLPVIGALGVGGYAYYDTGQVAKTAIELFSGVIQTDPSPRHEDDDSDGDGKDEHASKVGKKAMSDTPPRAGASKAAGTSRAADTRRRKATSTPKRATVKRGTSKPVTRTARTVAKTAKAVKPGKPAKQPQPSTSTQVKAKPTGTRPRKTS